ncbi:MAG: glycosyltransferase family 39 protein [Patescibacteria group bacterium]
MKNFFTKNWLLIFTIILAAILRLTYLQQIPVGFNDDEAAFGYNAYSISKTARDEWGTLMPFPAFESFGDWKLVGYLYLVVPFIYAFGLTEFATRFPSAIIGILAVFTTYLLAKEIFNKKTAIIASLLLAISPWHIAASRNAFESDILIFFNTLFIFFFYKSLNNFKYFKFFILTATITFYIYRSAWVFTPLLVFCLFLIFENNFKKYRKEVLKYFIISFVLLIPIILSAFSFRGQSRFIQESFIYGVQNSGISQSLNERLGFCSQRYSRVICRVVYNKPTFFISQFTQNYIENLSPNLYFINGTSGYQGFAPRGFLYFFELPLALAGLIYLLKKWSNTTKVILAWLLIVPLAPSLTSVGNPGRLNILLPLPQILASVGVIFLYSSVRQKALRQAFLLVVTAIILISFVRFIMDISTIYPIFTARSQRYGYKDVFNYAYSQKNNYEQIAISRKTDDAKQYIHFLMYTKYDPSTYHQKQIHTKDNQGWQNVQAIGKFHFYGSTPAIEELPLNSLLIVGEKEVDYPQAALKYYINDLRGDRLFEVYDMNVVNKIITDQNRNIN